MCIVVSYIPETKMRLERRKAFGGSEFSSQIMLKEGFMEQAEPELRPKGYGTVKLPHLLGQPCLAAKEALETPTVESSATITGMLKEIRSKAKFKTRAEIRISLVSTRAVAAVSSKSCARIHTHTILLADCPTDKPELVASLVPYRPIKHDWHSLCCSVKE